MNKTALRNNTSMYIVVWHLQPDNAHMYLLFMIAQSVWLSNSSPRPQLIWLTCRHSLGRLGWCVSWLRLGRGLGTVSWHWYIALLGYTGTTHRASPIIHSWWKSQPNLFLSDLDVVSGPSKITPISCHISFLSPQTPTCHWWKLGPFGYCSAPQAPFLPSCHNKISGSTEYMPC